MKKVLTVVFSILLVMFLVTVIETKRKPYNNDKLEDKLVVYSTYSEEVLNYLKQEFKTRTSVDVEFKRFNSDTELENELREEKSNPKADIILGGTSTLYKKLTKDDFFEKSYPTWCSDIDGDKKDKDGYWYGSSQYPITLFYNNDAIKALGVPSDLLNISDPKYKGLIGLNHLDSDATKYLLGSIMYRFYKEGKLEDGYKFLATLKANVKGEYDGDAKVISAVEAKEIALGVAPLNQVTSSRDKNKTPIGLMEGNNQFIVLIEGSAIIKGCIHPNAAKLFEEFAVGPKMELEISNKFNIIPVHQAALSNSPQWMKNIKDKTMDMDINVIEDNIAAWVDKWNSIVIEQVPPTAVTGQPTGKQ